MRKYSADALAAEPGSQVGIGSNQICASAPAVGSIFSAVSLATARGPSRPQSGARVLGLTFKPVEVERASPRERSSQAVRAVDVAEEVELPLGAWPPRHRSAPTGRGRPASRAGRSGAGPGPGAGTRRSARRSGRRCNRCWRRGCAPVHDAQLTTRQSPRRRIERSQHHGKVAGRYGPACRCSSVSRARGPTLVLRVSGIS